MQTDEDGGATITIDRSRMSDIRDAAGRAGVEPHDLVDRALRRYLAELEPDDRDRSDAGEPALFFDWTR